jgi:hypothetical protein
MREWEYREINLSDLPRKISELNLLDQAGEDGWELVVITQKKMAYLKREKRAQAKKT